MAFRQRDISTADDPIRTRQALQAIATEAAKANANISLLQLQGGDSIRTRQALQALVVVANSAAQSSNDRANEPVGVIGSVGARGILQRLAKDFENEIL